MARSFSATARPCVPRGWRVRDPYELAPELDSAVAQRVGGIGDALLARLGGGVAASRIEADSSRQIGVHRSCRSAITAGVGVRSEGQAKRHWMRCGGGRNLTELRIDLAALRVETGRRVETPNS